jgi:hypothetical protein
MARGGHRADLATSVAQRSHLGAVLARAMTLSLVRIAAAPDAEKARGFPACRAVNQEPAAELEASLDGRARSAK